MTTVLGILTFASGLILDGLNIVWGFQSARGRAFRSGIILIPLILYVFGGIVLWHDKGLRFIIVFVVAMLLFHASCYQILPWFFDLLFERKNHHGQDA